MSREEVQGGISSQIAEMINDASIDRIIAIDTQKNIISWNKSCELLTGIRKEDALEKGFFEIFEQALENIEIVKGIDGALNGLRMFVACDKCTFLGGYHESHFIPLKNEDGSIIGALCLMHDVAHRVKAENELKSLNRSLARKDKELKEKNAEILLFSHVTGHDLKEPLRRIYSFIELISSKESENLSGEGRSYLKRIQISVQRMGLLTDDLLNYSLLGKDRSEEISDLNLHSLLRFARNNLKEIIEEKNAIIESTALPVIKGYRTLIVDLLQHLLSNSLKFQKNDVAPHIFITTAILNGKEINDPDALADKNYLRVSVEDNGMGFEQKDAERIFQMFQRLNDKNAYPGTGIGLALCRKIMQLHNGFISAESEVGKGSIFHCYFPGSQ